MDTPTIDPLGLFSACREGRLRSAAPHHRRCTPQPSTGSTAVHPFLLALLHPGYEEGVFNRSPPSKSAAVLDWSVPTQSRRLHRRAEEHAAAGHASATHDDLDSANRFLASAREPDRGFFAHWCTSPEARLAGYRGNCAQLLGKAQEATTIIEDALVRVDESLLSIRSTVLADLATAYAKEGEVEHAADLLHHSLDLSADVGLVAHVQRVIGVRRHLSRWHDNPAVARLDEHIHHVTWVPL